jgi:hypothetical protein
MLVTGFTRWCIPGRIRLRQQGSSIFFLPDFCPQGKNLEEKR